MRSLELLRNSIHWPMAWSVPLMAAVAGMSLAGENPSSTWRIGDPIVTYWAGPSLTDAVARQMAEGNWSLVWCDETQLDIAHRHGLRAFLTNGLLSPQSLDDPAKKAQLDALIERVRKHPALYNYHLLDEPNAAGFPGLGRLVAYLRERDPAHLAYINLFPTYASNEQLGNQGDTVTAYKEHLQQFVEIVKPDLISYDHYHFRVGGDGDQYFLNLAMIRRAALDAGVPFLNIVQACSWHPSMRVPNGNELRWLVYTSLAYGAQGLSYYVYCHPGHEGAMARADGTPTTLYHAAKVLNRDFAAIAAQLQPLRSLGAYHTGVVPRGAEALPPDAPFRFEPHAPDPEGRPAPAGKDLLLGYFGATDEPTHVVAVSLDYGRNAVTTVVGPQQLQVFEAATGVWQPAGGSRIKLDLPPGGGKLLRAVDAVNK